MSFDLFSCKVDKEWAKQRISNWVNTDVLRKAKHGLPSFGDSAFGPLYDVSDYEEEKKVMLEKQMQKNMQQQKEKEEMEKEKKVLDQIFKLKDGKEGFQIPKNLLKSERFQDLATDFVGDGSQQQQHNKMGYEKVVTKTTLGTTEPIHQKFTGLVPLSVKNGTRADDVTDSKLLLKSNESVADDDDDYNEYSFIDEFSDDDEDTEAQLFCEEMFEKFCDFEDSKSCSTASTEEVVPSYITHPRFRRVYGISGDKTNFFYDGYYGSFEIFNESQLEEIKLYSAEAANNNPTFGAALCLQVVIASSPQYEHLLKDTQHLFPTLGEYRNWENRYFQQDNEANTLFFKKPNSMELNKMTHIQSLYPPKFQDYIEYLKNGMFFQSGTMLGPEKQQNPVDERSSKPTCSPELNIQTNWARRGHEFCGPEKKNYQYDDTKPPIRYRPISGQLIPIFCYLQDSPDSNAKEQEYWRTQVFDVQGPCAYSRNTLTCDENTVALYSNDALDTFEASMSTAADVGMDQAVTNDYEEVEDIFLEAGLYEELMEKQEDFVKDKKKQNKRNYADASSPAIASRVGVVKRACIK